MSSRLTDFAKVGVKHCLRRAGHALKCSDYLHKYCFGYHLAELFRHLDVRTVLDVGANVGGYRNFLRQEVGFRGLIISFEPVRRHVELLRKQARNDPNWVIHDYALGSEAGRQEINVMSGHVFSSFLAPDHTVVNEFEHLNTVDHRETVQVQTLDAVMDDLRSRHHFQQAFLKIDTQGYDLQVIRGGRMSLSQVQALQTEISIRPLYQGSPGFIEVYSELVALGFELTGMYPVVRDASMRLIEQDCVMVNRRAVTPATGCPAGRV